MYECVCMFSQVHVNDMAHMKVAYHVLYQNVELHAWKQSMQSGKIIKTASALFGNSIWEQWQHYS